jgi:hypothetical protein
MSSVECDWCFGRPVEEILYLFLDTLFSELTSCGSVCNSVLQIGCMSIIFFFLESLSLFLLEQSMLFECFLKDFDIWCAHVVILLDESASFRKVLIGSNFYK